MSTSATPRERLLEAAGELFYSDGVNIGVDALCKAAGVSKKSMYQLFRSKDELIAESLAARGPLVQSSAVSRARRTSGRRGSGSSRSSSARTSLLLTGNFLGCPYVATAVELKNPEHPGIGGGPALQAAARPTSSTASW